MRREASVAVRLLLEHHPLCSWFAGDRVQVGPLRVCSGCLAAVPAAALGFVVALRVIVLGVPPLPLCAGALVLGLPQLTTYLHRGPRAWRFTAKALGGLGLGGVAMSALLLPVPVGWIAGGAAGLVLAFVGLQAARVRSILRTCDACPYARDWDRCPGFQPADRAPATPSAS